MIDIEKFICSLIKHYCEAYDIDRTSIKCWFDDALEEQGLEYKNGEIIKTQRRVAAEAKEAIFDNEDERIRRDIIRILKGELGYTSKEDADKYIAWLEKQKYTQKDVDDAYLKGVTDTKNEMEKQGKQKPPVIDFKAKNWYVSKVHGKIYDMTYNPTDNIGPKFKVGDKVYNIKNGLECTIESIDEACYYCDMTNFDIKDQDGWKLVEQKPTWSEEDEDMASRIRDALRGTRYNYYYKDSIEMIDWLQSLKQRLGGK